MSLKPADNTASRYSAFIHARFCLAGILPFDDSARSMFNAMWRNMDQFSAPWFWWILLEHILLEFGGRNRGRPTVSKPVTTYLSEIDAVAGSYTLPIATVEAYHPDYIIWEKLTALHQFCTQENPLDTVRLSRHWYDVDCILQNLHEGSYQNMEALQDVVAMKSARWATRGVSFEAILSGALVLIPTGRLLEDIKKDYDQSVSGGMFFSAPDSFADIIERLAKQQDLINSFLNGRR